MTTPTTTSTAGATGWRRRWRADEGQVTGFAVIMILAVIALAGLVLDGGLAVAAKADAFATAQAAARAGAQHLDLALYRDTGQIRLDPAQAAAAARAWLASTGAHGVVTATQLQVRVEVTAAADTQLLSLVGIGSIAVHATATAVPVRTNTDIGAD